MVGWMVCYRAVLNNLAQLLGGPVSYLSVTLLSRLDAEFFSLISLEIENGEKVALGNGSNSRVAGVLRYGWAYKICATPIDTDTYTRFYF
jgi:hypothetical protein